MDRTCGVRRVDLVRHYDRLKTLYAFGGHVALEIGSVKEAVHGGDAAIPHNNALAPFSYPRGFQTRRANSSGDISWHKDRVFIRVYRDREQFSQEEQSGGITTTGILLAAGVAVRVKGPRDLMHLKSYAIDGRLLRTRSANWSPTGVKRQDNDLLYESSREAVERFEAKFEEMWAKPTNTSVGSPER